MRQALARAAAAVKERAPAPAVVTATVAPCGPVEMVQGRRPPSPKGAMATDPGCAKRPPRLAASFISAENAKRLVRLLRGHIANRIVVMTHFAQLLFLSIGDHEGHLPSPSSGPGRSDPQAAFLMFHIVLERLGHCLIDIAAGD